MPPEVVYRPFYFLELDSWAKIRQNSGIKICQQKVKGHLNELPIPPLNQEPV